VNPQNGEIPADVADQARMSLENVKAIITAAGLEWEYRQDDGIYY
jgi:Endoribonuclease L-PSP.